MGRAEERRARQRGGRRAVPSTPNPKAESGEMTELVHLIPHAIEILTQRKTPTTTVWVRRGLFRTTKVHGWRIDHDVKTIPGTDVSEGSYSAGTIAPLVIFTDTYLLSDGRFATTRSGASKSVTVHEVPPLGVEQTIKAIRYKIA